MLHVIERQFICIHSLVFQTFEWVLTDGTFSCLPLYSVFVKKIKKMRVIFYWTEYCKIDAMGLLLESIVSNSDLVNGLNVIGG